MALNLKAFFKHQTLNCTEKGTVHDGRNLHAPVPLFSRTYLPIALTLEAKRDFLRAAVFLWRTPFCAALSITLLALSNAFLTASASPAAIASVVRRIAV
jgi:hypothetical protein